LQAQSNLWDVEGVLEESESVLGVEGVDGEVVFMDCIQYVSVGAWVPVPLDDLLEVV
jgi:hypothetical protein